MTETEINEQKIIKSMDVTDDMDFIYTYEAEGLKKILIHKPKNCTGCGICVAICPSDAIELGPVPEIATGELDAPYIMIDQDKCDYCGICTLCPLNAMEFKFNDKEIKEIEGYPELDRSISLDENKCVKCFLCEEICPRDAIEARVKVTKKDELVKYPGNKSFKDYDIKGKIQIDLEKCTYCKLCDKLCDALEVIPAEASPLNIYAGKRIDISYDECDYCGLCEKICPVDAIKVSCETIIDRTINDPKIEGSINIDESKCIYCDWCGVA